MTDHSNQEALIDALNNIASELKRINQALTGLGGQAVSRPSAPGASRGPASYRSSATSRGPAPRGDKPAYGKPRREGFGATESEGEEREGSPRFAGKKPPLRSGIKKKPTKSPMSFKKKEGYPKRPK